MAVESFEWGRGGHLHFSDLKRGQVPEIVTLKLFIFFGEKIKKHAIFITF